MMSSARFAQWSLPVLVLLSACPAAAQDLIMSFQGDAPGDQFGRTLALVGDVDADGVSDLAIGIPGSDVSGIDAGEVRLYSGLNGQLLRVAYGQNPGDSFGGALAALGDVDGDGIPDLIVGATTDNKFQGAYGGQYIRVLSGADASLIHHLTTPFSYTMRFGFSVAGAGDLDGDGRGDFIVGAPDFEPDCPWGWWCNGAAFVYSGASATLLHSVTSGSIEWTPGFDVTAGSDLDGDGLPEWIVGNPDYFGESNFQGHAWVYSGATGALQHDFQQPQVNPNRVGRVVEFVGDLDADGVDDILVCQGEWGFSYTFGDGGPKLTRLYSGASKSLIRTIPDTYDSAAALGDLDLDGRDDVLLGHAYANRLELRSGLNALNLLGVFGANTGDRLGAAVVGVGDLDSDSYPDFAVGAPQTGTAGAGYVLVVKGFQDCNSDGLQDAAQLAQGSLADSNGNGLPDECECSAVTYCASNPNSTGQAASIGWSGSLSITANQLHLEVDHAVPGQVGIFFFGLDKTQSPFGEGYLCVTGGIKRLAPGVPVNAQGQGSYLVDFNDPTSPASALVGGDLRNFQFWYRDPQPVGYGYNLSNGLEITLCP